MRSLFLFANKESVGVSLGELSWKRFKKNKGAMLGLLFIIFLIFVAVFGEFLMPFNPRVQILQYQNLDPGSVGNVILQKNPLSPDIPRSIPILRILKISSDSVRYEDMAKSVHSIAVSELAGNSEEEWHQRPTYYLGTDNLGRDFLSRLIQGEGVSMRVAVLSELISLILGVIMGSIAGYFRGWIDDIVSWIINVVWAFPTILLVISFSAFLQTDAQVLGFRLDQVDQLTKVAIAIGLTGWVDLARVIRGQFFSLREMDYIEATRAFGFGTWRTIIRHLIPNTLSPIIVVATAGFATAIILEASLSYIGLGVQRPVASWGRLIEEGRAYMYMSSHLHLVLVPSIVIALTVFAFNLLGDGLRDALDPKTSQRS